MLVLYSLFPFQRFVPSVQKKDTTEQDALVTKQIAHSCSSPTSYEHVGLIYGLVILVRYDHGPQRL